MCLKLGRACGGGVGANGGGANFRLEAFHHGDLRYCIIFSFGGYVTGVDPLFCGKLSGKTAEQHSVFVPGSVCLYARRRIQSGGGAGGGFRRGAPTSPATWRKMLELTGD